MIIDFHAHFGDTGVWLRGPDQAVAWMDRWGLDRAVLVGGLWREDGADDWRGGSTFDCRRGNEETAKALRKYPDRFLGFVWANANRPEVLDDIRRYVEQHGFRGVKFAAYLNHFPVYSEPVFRICELAREYRLIVASHTDHGYYSNPLHLAALASDFPDLNFVMIHMGWYQQAAIRQCIEAARSRPNLFLGTESMPYPRMIRLAVTELGPERVLFGSDAGGEINRPGGGNDIRYELGKVKAARLTPHEERLVMGENAARLLGLS
jgi:hypothetical protein